MFRHHHHGPHGHFGRGHRGFHWHDRAERHGHGPGGRMGGRFFDHGDLRLVALKHIAEKPRYGYELIKLVEEKSGGAYSPSPGVIYPTLTLLEEMGYVTASDAGGGKKLYTITAEGEGYLADNAGPVQGLFERMAEFAARAAVFSPKLMRAQENLRTAMKLKVSAGPLTDAQVTAIAAALDAAAKAIEEA